MTTPEQSGTPTKGDEADASEAGQLPAEGATSDQAKNAGSTTQAEGDR